MPNLSAPYNFVPLHKHVVRPQWAGQVSHDKPFSDGQSGKLELTITAASPIFTRNSVSRLVANDDERKEKGSHFSKLAESYFLPGSSIKGAIRSVLEVMSFGDITVGREEERYAMRDLHHEAYKAMFAENAQQKVHGGWLFESNGNYIINDCGEPLKVPQAWIDEHFLTGHFKAFAAGTMQMKDEYKAAQKKYSLFAGRDLSVTFNGIAGTLVFTGQPSANTLPTAKQNEFLFPTSARVVELTTAVFRDFQMAYFEHDRPAQKPDYKHWMKKLTGGEKVPVFFHVDGQGNVVSLGLAFMYKIPFTYSALTAIKRYQGEGRGPDLAQCIFGHVEKDNSLKGRVTFGHAKAMGAPQPMPKKSEVLNSPKPTYYPTYIRQKVDGNGLVPKERGRPKYSTLFDKDAVPSGWKRYPIHSDGVKTTIGSESLKTLFCPLPSGTTFACTVTYHNLRLIELGALLSALSFHNSADCFHTFGMAKPLGYGKCSISIAGITEELRLAAMQSFEVFMESEVSGWATSEAITELLTMSSNQDNKEVRSQLKYMGVVGDFATAKRDGEALDRYSKLPGVKQKKMDPLLNTTAAAPGKNQPPPPVSIDLEAVFLKEKNRLLDDLKKRKGDMQAAEEEEKVNRAAAAIKEAALARQREDDARVAAAKAAQSKLAETRGLDLSGIKPKDITLFSNLVKAIEKHKRLATLSSADFDAIRLKLADAYAVITEKERARWQAEPQHTWDKLIPHVDVGMLAEWKETIPQMQGR